MLLACASVQVHQMDETHNVSGKFAAVAFSAQAKAREVDTKYVALRLAAFVLRLLLLY